MNIIRNGVLVAALFAILGACQLGETVLMGGDGAAFVSSAEALLTALNTHHVNRIVLLRK